MYLYLMNFSDILSLSQKSIRSNKLRTVLTMLIIAVGITALVSILTAIDSFIFTMSDNFSSLGANSFNIVPSGQELGGRKRGKQQKRGEPISYDQAVRFQEALADKSTVTVSFRASSGATVKYKDQKTDPNVELYGNDENYVLLNKRELVAGRNFSKPEIRNGQSKAIVGMGIVKKLFDHKPQKAIGQNISINAIKYKIIGVLKSEGSSMNQNSDRWVMIPVLTAKSRYATNRTNFMITASAKNATILDQVLEESIGIFRRIRKLKIGEPNDFKIKKSEGMIEMLRENTSMIRLAALVIALMTILSAAVGLMNIMLVSVTERTREIGITKALGATRRNILYQFLAEATIICLVGGLIGIAIGILLGNVVVLLIGGSFLIPWNWIAIGLLTCTIVGITAGFYPAMKASRLDPIEALRYE